MLYREEEDAAYVHTFVRRMVILRQQIRAQLYKDGSLGQRLRPDVLFDIEGV